MLCRGCSKGCRLELVEEKVVGNLCSKGPSYYLSYTTQVEGIYKYYLPVKNGYMKHILIVSDQPIAYDNFRAIDALMQQIHLEAPVEKDQIVLAKPLGLSVNLKSARLLKRRA